MQKAKKNEAAKVTASRPLDMTETLVFIIVDYMLDHNGYGYSTQISEYVVSNYPRRYTSREVVGILRNRPMFGHAQSNERRAGKKWRLDLLGWDRYLKNSRNKDLPTKAESWSLPEKVLKLKMAQIADTITALEELNPENLDGVYEAISSVWSGESPDALDNKTVNDYSCSLSDATVKVRRNQERSMCPNGINVPI